MKKTLKKVIQHRTAFLLVMLPLFFYLGAVSQTAENSEKYIDTSAFYQRIKLQDNFYLFVNGNWIIDNPVPSSKYYWNNFQISWDTNLERLNNLYQQAAVNAPLNSADRLSANLYLSGIDTALIEAKGYSEIKNQLLSLDSLKDTSAVLTEIARLQTTDGIGNCLFNFHVEKDALHPGEYISIFSPPGFFLENEDYYIGLDNRSKDIQYAYLKLLKDMFKLVGFSNREANNKGNAVFEIEADLARSSISGNRRGTYEYPIYSLGNFETSTQIKWKQVLEHLQVNLKPQDSIVVDNLYYFNSITGFLDKYPVKTWIAYLQWTLIYNSALYLNKSITDRVFDFKKMVTGQRDQSPRWAVVTSIVDNRLPGISGNLYAYNYFTDSAKKKVAQVVGNLKKAFAERIKSLTWMTDLTKNTALEKLNAITGEIGFPEKWPAYEGLVIKPDDFAGNIKRIKIFDFQSMINKLGKKVNRGYWDFSTAMINAFYSPLDNEIYLPAGILQPPFFDITADDAVNYGAIGSIIGHELTHGFDYDGSEYDKDGRLYNWWKEADATQFSKKVNDLKDQYNNLRIGYQVYVNGSQTTNENIADFGGVAIAYDAFKKTEQGQGAVLIDGLSPDQRFFISFAQTYRSTIAPETAYEFALKEEHAPAMFRCNLPLSNLEAFYRAFDIQKKDGMYKSPAKRLSIW